MLNITRRRRMATAMAMAGKPGTAVRRATPCRAELVRRIEVPLAADGVAGTAVRRATPCRAAIVHPIKVGSAPRRAGGMATEPSGRRHGAGAGYCTEILPREFRASDVVPRDVARDRLNRGI